ncbi:MAG: HAMP domain-containing histidine kinase [Acidobacteria bacterium]|nr:HAMP domain-containing histidine kinase [Acidobacteriota bacterium]MBV9144532.1 HAMP domain-containing histidine kinase [Acidobacteriota bacterium]MBV9435595.1 HAMP domain-containing histidine kinase [Acidobacteriota bacterium]
MTCALVAVLATLASLQYRWSKQVSDAGRARMTAELVSSMMGFRRDFARELSTLTFPFQEVERAAPEKRQAAVAQSSSEMMATAAHAKLVKHVFLANERSGKGIQLYEVTGGKLSLTQGSWPAELVPLREALPASGPSHDFRRPRHLPEMHGRLPDRNLEHGPSNGPGQQHGPPWFIAASVPALIRPLHEHVADTRAERGRQWIVIELDREFIREHLFPELVSRYFPNIAEQSYDVEVTSSAGNDVFDSGRQLTEHGADARLDLFGIPGPPREWNSAVPQLRNGARLRISGVHIEEAGASAPILLPDLGVPGDSNWVLLARNRQGSLETAVAQVRTENLAFSFGILVVLAATMGIILLASHRARRLAQLQMNFVAGVSHELRTPITVISSAAENIADGVIENKRQIARYGQVIKNQAGQLKQLVEQILLFATTQHGNTSPPLHPSSVEDAIELALTNMSETIRQEGIQLEKSIQTSLPPLLINVQALAQCLQNLIANAVKYRGESHWLGIAAALHDPGEVMISVSDRGIGIDSADMKHIFEPFYRASEVRDAQIHGTGLGLSVAKSTVENMGGRITVESRRGGGTSFFIHIPVPALEEARVSPRHPKIVTSDLHSQ